MKMSLKALRINANMTQRDFAGRLGVDVRSYHLWETGKTPINIRTKLAIQEILNTDRINFPKLKK